MTIHNLIDLETGGLPDDCNQHGVVIYSIGSVMFNEEEIIDAFSININIKNQLGATTDSTLDWWESQSQAAKDALIEDQVSLTEALTKFAQWYRAYNPRTTWGNSPSFDQFILKKAMNSCSVRCPWFFTQERDLRTIKHLTTPISFEGTQHVALDDAIHEARIVQQWLGLSEFEVKKELML